MVQDTTVPRRVAALPWPYRSPAIGLFTLCYLLGTAFGPAIVALILAP